MAKRGGDGSAGRVGSSAPHMGSTLFVRALAADAQNPLSPPSAAALAWAELLSGRMEMVDHFAHDGRRYIVVRLEPFGDRTTALTGREKLIAARRVQGASLKAIADELGISISTVAKALQRVLRKLRVRNIAELVSLFGRQAMTDLRAAPFSAEGANYLVLSHSASAPVLPPGLTLAEREIVSALLRGLSNGEIAAQRGVALRTVANQVASIFRKMDVRSRVELVRKLEL